MYTLKNALKNIINSPVRNLILGAIIMLICIICCISFALLRVSEKAEKDALTRVMITAKVVKEDVDSIDVSNDLIYIIRQVVPFLLF